MCPQERCAVIERPCGQGVRVCAWKCACACLDPGLWGRGLQVSNSSAIFRGHISSAVQRPGCVSLGESHSPCPLPLTLQHCLPPTRCLYSESLLLPFHTRRRCYHRLPPGGIPGARSPPGRSRSPTGSGPLGLGSSGREGPGEREGNRGGAAASAILSC